MKINLKKLFNSLPRLSLNLDVLIYKQKSIYLNQKSIWKKTLKVFPYLLLLITKIILDVFLSEKNIFFNTFLGALTIFLFVAFISYIVLSVIAILVYGYFNQQSEKYNHGDEDSSNRNNPSNTEDGTMSSTNE